LSVGELSQTKLADKINQLLVDQLSVDQLSGQRVVHRGVFIPPC